MASKAATAKNASIPAILPNEVKWRRLETLRPYPKNSRRHPPAQIRELQRSISTIGWMRPIGIDDDGMILFGHGCFEAAKGLELELVPTLTLSGLTAAMKAAIVIADNKTAENSTWDFDILKSEISNLINIDFPLELTGFSVGEIDLMFKIETEGGGAANDDSELLPDGGPAVSAVGDTWNLGPHRLICADARDAEPYRILLGNDLAQMVVTDAPYNVPIQGHARGRGRKKQREFVMASGEMSSPVFTGFLESVMSRAVQFSTQASIHYWFMDWRHLPELLRASAVLYGEWKNLLVWRKSNAGQGSFYRSQHELIAVFKSGTGQHINNFGLGSEGRHRTNVLDYAGGATPTGERQQELDMHPTVKPVALIADLLLDCSKRNGIVLDMFGGSGTLILAAEKTGRRARVIELDPLYVDLAVRRWQAKTGEKAIHAVSGKSFDQLAGAAND